VVKLRLMRMGKKKQPTYRIVAADSRSPRNGRFIEIVGTYEPRRDPSVIEIDNDRAVHWLQNGAQPTERVAKLLEVTGAWEQFKTGVAPAAPKPPPEKAEKPAKAAKAEAPSDDDAEDAADTESADATEDE
jgi:small subunit ribosomal protein S16